MKLQHVRIAVFSHRVINVYIPRKIYHCITHTVIGCVIVCELHIHNKQASCLHSVNPQIKPEDTHNKHVSTPC